MARKTQSAAKATVSTSKGAAKKPVRSGIAGSGRATASVVSRSVRDDFADYLVDALSELGPIQTKRFFSGTGLLLDDVQFAFIIRGSLYMRVDETGQAAFRAAGSGPFTYRTSKREVALTGYYAVPAGMLEDTDELCDWSRRAFRIAQIDREIKAAKASRRSGKNVRS